MTVGFTGLQYLQIILLNIINLNTKLRFKFLNKKHSDFILLNYE